MIGMYHPGIKQRCDAVNADQAEHLTTLGWQFEQPAADDAPAVVFADTAEGLERTLADIEALNELAALTPAELAAVAEIADVIANPPADPKPSTPRKPKD